MDILHQLHQVQSLTQKALDASLQNDWVQTQSNIDLRDQQLESILPSLSMLNNNQITEAKVLLESISSINSELNDFAKEACDKLVQERTDLTKSQKAISRYLDNSPK